LKQATSDTSLPHLTVDILIVYHDRRGGLFPTSGAGLNKNNPIGLLYSIADELEDFRWSDGSFRFKLCYPGKET
jgi:hypothetical protein